MVSPGSVPVHTSVKVRAVSLDNHLAGGEKLVGALDRRDPITDGIEARRAETAHAGSVHESPAARCAGRPRDRCGNMGQ
jgi:hypothetical protein